MSDKPEENETRDVADGVHEAYKEAQIYCHECSKMAGSGVLVYYEGPECNGSGEVKG